MSIQIKLVCAVLTHDTEAFTNMDPYCMLKLGQQTFKSKTKGEAGKRPVWNETFTFNTQENILQISISDQDTASDDIIGQGTLDISKFRNNPNEQNEFVQIFYQGKSAGKVQLIIRGIAGNIQNIFGQGNPYTQPNQFNQQQNPNNPLEMIGPSIAQQIGNNGQSALQNNYQAQYQMINGFGVNNPNYGNNPNNPFQ